MYSGTSLEKLPTESQSRVLIAFHQVVFKYIHQYFIPIPRGVGRGPRERFLSLIKRNDSSLTLRTTALS